MPITYEHRVPASTLGGLALAAGQEQYEAQRGREDREKAMKLAQMAQQQQMQEQRMAYDAAATQYRTAADYNKFVMSAALDMVGQERNQENRLALQNNQDQLGAGREEARWDRAQKQAGQQDTFAAWEQYVTATLPGLNQDGRDILNTHSGRVRSIMSNQNFNRTQKAAAVSQVLEEVQGLGLEQNYAMEQQYEPGQTYHDDNGEIYLWDGRERHLVGRHYDNLVKPDDMSDADWMGGGRNAAWMDEHTVFETRDEDGKRVRHFRSDGKWESIVDEDAQYKREQQEIKDDAMRIEDEKVLAEHRDKKAAYAKDYLDAMNAASPIGNMMGPGEEPLDNEGKLAELERRRKKARDVADEQFPPPPRRVPAAGAAGPAAAIDDSAAFAADVAGTTGLGGGGEAEPPATSGIPEWLLRPEPEPEPLERPPLGDAGAGPAEAGSAEAAAAHFLRMSENFSDPGVKDLANAAYEIMQRGGPRNEDEAYLLRQAESAIRNSTKHAEMALAGGMSLGEGGTAHFGEAYTNRLRRAQALKKGQEERGTGDIARAREMAGGPGELWNVTSPSGVLWGEEFIKPLVNPEEGTKSGSPWIGGGDPTIEGLSAPGGTFPGQREDKPRFERTPEQVKAEKNIRALGGRPDEAKTRETTYKGSIVKVPVEEFKRKKGEGQVGAMSGSTAPPGVSAETERIRKARGEDPYSESELKDMARRAYPKARELTKEEKLQDRIKDPKTVKEAVFEELWQERDEAAPGRTGLARSDSPRDIVEEFKKFRSPTKRKDIGKLLTTLKERFQELGLDQAIYTHSLDSKGRRVKGYGSPLMRTTSLDLQKKDAMSYDVWVGNRIAEVKRAEDAMGRKIYDALDEWDAHMPNMTEEKFLKKFREDPDLRSQYQDQLSLKLMIKEGRSGQESAKARQERFERDYREQRKYEEGQ